MPRGEPAHERARDLVWELLEAQPDHPRIAAVAHELLAEDPEDSGMELALATHHRALGEYDEARRRASRIVARSGKFLDEAVHELRVVEADAGNWHRALHWAREQARLQPDNLLIRFQVARYRSRLGEREPAWDAMDAVLAELAATQHQRLDWSAAVRANELLVALAPFERFVPAAEEAIRLNPADGSTTTLLAWAYLVSHRFSDAEEVGLRLLRIDPTNGPAQAVVATARELSGIVAKALGDPELGHTEEGLMAAIRESGVLQVGWQTARDRELGVDVDSALAELDRCLPDALREALLPGSDSVESGHQTLLAWHDGQRPGTGAAWGWTRPFRLLSDTEIGELDRRIEGDPQWPEDEMMQQIATDDDGSWLIEVAFGRMVVRRAGRPDEPLAESLAHWLWDRVRDLGGRDARDDLPGASVDPVAD